MNNEARKKVIYPIIAVCLIVTSYFFALFILEKIKYNVLINEKALGILVNDFNGNKMLIDTQDYVVSDRILHTGQWEPYISNVLNKVIKPGQTVVSIGGHIGYHAINQSQIVGDRGHVYCFEPNPHNLKFLRANVVLNNVNNMTIYDKAAYSRNGVLRFAARKNTGCSHVITDKTAIEKDAKEIEVNAVTLDDVLKHVDKIDVLQMDIEGSEPNAIYGAKDIIQRSPNLTVVQEWNVAIMSGHSDVPTYVKFWRDLGYSFAQILDNALVELSDKQLLQNPACDVVITKDLPGLMRLYS